MSNEEKQPLPLLSVGEAREYKRVKYITYQDDKSKGFLAISSQPGVSFCLEAATDAEIETQAHHAIDQYWKVQYQESRVPDIMRESGKKYMDHLELERRKAER